MGFLGRIPLVPPHLPLTHAEVFILSSNAPLGLFRGTLFGWIAFFPFTAVAAGAGRRDPEVRMALGPAGRGREPLRARGAWRAGAARFVRGSHRVCRSGAGSRKNPRGPPSPAEHGCCPFRAAFPARGGQEQRGLRCLPPKSGSAPSAAGGGSGRPAMGEGSWAAPCRGRPGARRAAAAGARASAALPARLSALTGVRASPERLGPIQSDYARRRTNQLRRLMNIHRLG